VWTLPWIEANHENGNGNRASPAASTEAQIEGQYAAMGAYLARYSHVLLALWLWDGDDLPEHERTGGTAHIVCLRLYGAPPPYGPVISPLERAGYGAVHHILTPRQSRPLLEKAQHQTPFALQVLPLGETVEDFLGKQRGELNWIRHAIKSCNVLADAQDAVPTFTKRLSS